MKIISISNQKGGCGKTTTAVNLAASLSRLGSRVLLIDLDPQGHATLGLGLVPDEIENTIYDAITKPGVSVLQCTQQSRFENLSICPSNILLSGGELELSSRYAREFILGQKLSYLHGSFDYCIIDCSPSLSVLTINALTASHLVVIPVQMHYYAMEGLKQLLETITIVKERYNNDIKIAGILLTFADNTKLTRQVEAEMRDYFGDLVFSTVIRRNVRLAEAPSVGEPVLSYAGESAGAHDYFELAREIKHETTADRTW